MKTPTDQEGLLKIIADLKAERDTLIQKCAELERKLQEAEQQLRERIISEGRAMGIATLDKYDARIADLEQQLANLKGPVAQRIEEKP